MSSQHPYSTLRGSGRRGRGNTQGTDSSSGFSGFENTSSGGGSAGYDIESGKINRRRSLIRRDRSKRSVAASANSVNRDSSYRDVNARNSYQNSYRNSGAPSNSGAAGHAGGVDPITSGRRYSFNGHDDDEIPLQDIPTHKSSKAGSFTTETHELHPNSSRFSRASRASRASGAASGTVPSGGPSDLNAGGADSASDSEHTLNASNDSDDERAPLRGQFYSMPANKRVKELEKDPHHFPFWKCYCYLVTFWAPAPLLSLFGFKTKERQYAWREKMGLISIILVIGAIIAFLTFGFTRSACTGLSDPIRALGLSTGFLVINGRAYDLSSSSHPSAPGIDAGTNVLYDPIKAGGKDASFLFQNVNGNCKGLITPKENCSIPYDGEEVAWYMPCKLFDVDGSTEVNSTWDYYDGYACHTALKARKAFYSLSVHGSVFYSWDEIANKTRNLVVYNGNVLDMDLLDWLQTDDLDYPARFDEIKNDKKMRGYDISRLLSSPHDRQVAECLTEIIKVGQVDTSTVGCISASIVLYVSLVFVLLLVFVQFFCACYFKWFVAPKQGVSKSTARAMAKHDRVVDDWTDSSRMAPIQTVSPKLRANFHGGHSTEKGAAFSKDNSPDSAENHEYRTNNTNNQDRRRTLRMSWGGDLSEFDADRSTAELAQTSGKYKPKYLTMTTEAYMISQKNKHHTRSASGRPPLDPFKTPTIGALDDSDIQTLDPAIVHPDVVPQPPVSWEPFGYPLLHTMCLVTCYSEDESGIRTTIDSIATTDYPNSHKLLLVICDGIITGAGNEKSTPDICLDLMEDLVVPKDQVQPHSYVSVAQGSKRHNMAKVYAGYYKYDDNTVPPEKQQRIPMMLVVKCGTPAEITAAKPGNRGKRDSQIILMSFLQSITYNERMTDLEFEMLKSIWQVTGLMASFYESVLMVDADTLVYPDCLTHMLAELVKDPEIMGLCGETKISNKTQSWVTAIQVFEYYLAHHQAKAFESVFGCVTCLPGCFCMYRIKAPKDLNVWVPILSNADIVAKYSDNVLDSLHKKNLLLLGEDRYLSSLMLRTFPRRKQVFVPKAACKTVVPDKFKVLLSQRRRWINSTVHNLMELARVTDLCGTFIFSMQFIIIVTLIGTLVLPAAITFTLYIIFIAIFSHPKPIMSLILMLIVFGLPAVLIVLTVSNPTYILWMLVYLIALPIWNFVLPTYSYWKFDDFSWGDTRKTSGAAAKKQETDGEFDGSQIGQMTWREYERRRRNEAGTGVDHMPTAYNPGLYDLDSDVDFVDMQQKMSQR